MKYIISLGIVLSLLVGVGHSEDLAVYAGYTLFPNPAYDSVTLVEFPFSINRSDLEFFQSDSNQVGYYARVFAQVDIFGADAMPFDSVRTYFSVPIDDLKKALDKNQRVFNSLKIFLPAGIYSAKLTVIDVKSKAKGEFFINTFTVNPPVKTHLALGGFTTAFSIQYVGTMEPEKQSVFYKNGYYIIMNPLDLYTVNDSIMYLYGELYNLNYSPEHASKYMVTVSALTQTHELYTNFGARVREKPGTAAVFTEKLNISGWPKGHYFLQVVATDLTTQQTDTILEPLHIISEGDVMLAMAQEKRRLLNASKNTSDPYDSLSLNQKVQLVQYLLTKEQQRTLKSLNPQGKITYLSQFWEEHDENPSSTINENRIEMIQRFRYVNQFFSTNDVKDNGWNTPRGRIYMTYGLWSDREDVEAPRIGNPFEIWWYDHLGKGYVFVFDDWTGNDDFRLIHSNVPGEPYSSEWEERLRTDYMHLLE